VKHGRFERHRELAGDGSSQIDGLRQGAIQNVASRDPTTTLPPMTCAPMATDLVGAVRRSRGSWRRVHRGVDGSARTSPELAAEILHILAQVAAGALTMAFDRVPLADVATAWADLARRPRRRVEHDRDAHSRTRARRRFGRVRESCAQ
jgi:hypothetical protein